MIQQELMTTKEVAAYLRIKERKVYELISARRIPCSRVAGKWLFPRCSLTWVVQNSEGSSNLNAALNRPPIVGGSHDPLLEWCVRESGCELATMFNGSLDGLQRLLMRRYCAAVYTSLIQTRLIITGPLPGAPWLTSTWCLLSGPGANRA